MLDTDLLPIDFKRYKAQKLALSREEALEMGAKTYKGKKPCRRGHDIRSTLTGHCVQCQRDVHPQRYPSNSKMVAIDRKKTEPDFLDDYYRM